MGVDAGFVSVGVWVWGRGGEWEEWECGAGLRDGGDGWAMTEGIEATNNVDREMGGKIFTFESVGLLKFGQGQFITI
jgi:hypothetical protein